MVARALVVCFIGLTSVLPGNDALAAGSEPRATPSATPEGGASNLQCTGSAVAANWVESEHPEGLPLGSVYFGLESSALSGANEQALDNAYRKALEYFASQPTLWISVVGYTDKSGTEGHNHRLAESRTNAVKSFLISHGIPAYCIDTRALAAPVAPDPVAKEAAGNRRVDIEMLGRNRFDGKYQGPRW